MVRDLLVHVDGTRAGRRRVQFAVDLALRTGARLSGLHVIPPVEVAPHYKPSLVTDVAAEVASRLVLDARTAATIFSEEATQRMAGTATGEVVQGITDQARCADVVIVGQDEWQGSPEAHPLPIAHSVVLRCGRPVLVVHAAVEPSALARVAIAWDGSREAVRAVHDALPLQRLAELVQIVTGIRSSCSGDDEVGVKSLLAHLVNHGVPMGTVLEIGSAEEHQVLRDQIEQGHYDLLVMWGYSHPIWPEFIFGGLTQSILLSSKIPVLVSH